MECKICGSVEIKGNCQYINGYYYHNHCIEKLTQENQHLKEQLKDEEEQRIKIAKDREQTYKDCLLLIEQKKELRSWLEKKLASDICGDDMYYGFKACLLKLNKLEGGKND